MSYNPNAAQATNPIFTATDNITGLPLAGGLLYTYASGTTNLQATYTDNTLTTQMPNPIVLDNYGQAFFWMSNIPYRFDLFNAAGAHQAHYPVDNVSPANAAIFSSLAAPTGATLIGTEQSGTGAVARTVQQKLSDVVSVLDYGADPTGAVDSTPAFTAAKTALTKGGTIQITPGIYACNLVLDSTWTGIRIQGQGTEQALTVPLTGYLKPYNVNLPVIQVGANTPSAALTSGTIISGVCLYGANTGLYGLVYAGGAYRNFAENIQILNFTTRCLAFTCLPQATQANGLPCSYNKIRGLTVQSSVVGATGIYFEDSAQTNDNYAYTTANSITDFDVTSNNGYQLWTNSAGAGFLSNGYVQQSYSGLGAYFSQGYYRQPLLDFSNVILDNAAGGSAVTAIINNGVDWQSTTVFNSEPINGTLQSTGPILQIVSNTTGSINSGQATLTLAATTNVLSGRTILVAGAGVSGQPLITTVLSVSGSVATLSANASTTVTNAATMIGDQLGDMPFLQVGNSWSSPNGIFLGQSNLTQLPYYSENGTLFRGGKGSVAPLNSIDTMWYLAGQNHNYISDDANGSTIASITQSTTTVTETTNSANNVAPGDVVKIAGCTNAPGINGDWLVTARSSTTVFTYTSTVSQSVTASGTLTMKNNKISSWRAGGNLRIAGSLYMRDESGNWTAIIQQSLNNSNFQFFTPDQTNGVMIFNAATATTTSTVFGFLSGSVLSGFNGYGALGVGCQNNSSRVSVKLPYATGAPTAAAGFGYIYLDTSGNLYYQGPTTSTKLANA